MATIEQRRRAAPRRTAQRICVVCGASDPTGDAWQISQDGRTIHCDGCAALLVVALDDQLLFWPVCGHALDDGAVLYDQPLCVLCDAA